MWQEQIKSELQECKNMDDQIDVVTENAGNFAKAFYEFLETKCSKVEEDTWRFEGFKYSSDKILSIFTKKVFKGEIKL